MTERWAGKKKILRRNEERVRVTCRCSFWHRLCQPITFGRKSLGVQKRKSSLTTQHLILGVEAVEAVRVKRDKDADAVTL